MPWIILGIIISYLLGSIPTAYIFGRMLKGVDIRKFGSGNVGATNALRLLGKGPGIAVLLLDIIKGILPVAILVDLLPFRSVEVSGELLRVIFGLACVCGHNWTVFLQFKGGKGIATTLGVLLGLAFKVAGLKIVLALVLSTWLLIFIITKFVSLASVISAASLPFYMLFFKQSAVIVFASIILSIATIFRHKANIKRLLKGEEKKVSFSKR